MASAFLEVGRYSFDNILCMPYTEWKEGVKAAQLASPCTKQNKKTCYVQLLYKKKSINVK